MSAETRQPDHVALGLDGPLMFGAMESAVCGVVISRADADQQIVYANEAFAKMTGYTPAEVVGSNCRFLNEGLGDQLALEHIRRAVRNGEACEATILNRRKDGTTFWNSLRISPIHDAEGRLTHFIGFQLDVTSARDAFLEIRNARDQLGAILASAPNAIFTVDADQRITSFNSAAEQLFGWSRQEILDRGLDELVPEVDRDRHRGISKEFLQSAMPDGPMTHAGRVVEARRKDGSRFPAWISLGRYIEFGRPAVAATAIDMTEMVATKAKLEDLSARLAQQLRTAEDASRAKDQFFASMSHELRTPLNAIIGFSELIETIGPERLSRGKLLEYIADIRRSGSYLLELVNDILDLSKIEANAIEIDSRPHDTAVLMERAMETIGPIARRKSIDIKVDKSTDRYAHCDGRAMNQCLLNILSNSVKYSEVGTQISVSIQDADDRIWFVIRDKGLGMPRKVLDKIGQPFQRTTDPSISGVEGTGLGLSITYKLMGLQDGEVRVESELGVGTTVWLGLPVAGMASTIEFDGNAGSNVHGDAGNVIDSSIFDKTTPKKSKQRHASI